MCSPPQQRRPSKCVGRLAEKATGRGARQRPPQGIKLQAPDTPLRDSVPCRPVPVFPAGVSAVLPFRVGGGYMAGDGCLGRLGEGFTGGKKPGRGGADAKFGAWHQKLHFF
jgi:hypothetical protein